MRDFVSNIQEVRAPNQTLSGVTPNNSQAIDRRGFDALRISLQTGVVTDAGTADGFTMKLQHSDTLVGADFSDVPAIQMVNNVATVVVTSDDADTVTAGVLGYLGNRRYVRAVFTGTTGTNAVVHIHAMLGRPHRAPTTPIGASLATT
jgi:hypothetical protein